MTAGMWSWEWVDQEFGGLGYIIAQSLEGEPGKENSSCSGFHFICVKSMFGLFNFWHCKTTGKGEGWLMEERALDRLLSCLDCINMNISHNQELSGHFCTAHLNTAHNGMWGEWAGMLKSASEGTNELGVELFSSLFFLASYIVENVVVIQRMAGEAKPNSKD